jgi:hypothetical protein
MLRAGLTGGHLVSIPVTNTVSRGRALGFLYSVSNGVANEHDLIRLRLRYR